MRNLRDFGLHRAWHRCPALLLGLSLSLFSSIAIAAGSVPAVAGLQRELDRLVSGFDGSVGAFVLDLRSGRSAQVNGDIGFPMASTAKVPVAVHILALVDEGTLGLQQQVLLEEGDIYPAMGGPLDIHLSPGSAITIRDLLHMMLAISDNNATDILIRLGGGPAAVDARMRALGMQGIRMDRYIWEMLSHYMGALEVSAGKPISPTDYARLDALKRSEAEKLRYRSLYNGDPRDTGTPSDMAELLAKIWNGRALTPTTTTVLKEILLDCRTGSGRLKGMLPEATPVAHKTGTVGDVINDVGVITLPDGKGEVVVVVFLKSALDGLARERQIAQIARAAHDFFLFTTTD